MPPFRYDPFVDPYVGTISDLMGKGDEAKARALLAIGEIQARAAEQRGQAWGGSVESLGNIASKGLTDWATEREQAPIRAHEAERRSREAANWEDEDAAKREYNKILTAPNQQGIAMQTVAGAPAELDSRSLVIGPDGQPIVDATGKLVYRDQPGAPAELTSRQGVPTITNPYQQLSVGGVRGLNLYDEAAMRAQFAQAGVSPERAEAYVAKAIASNDRMKAHHKDAVAMAKQHAGDINSFSDAELIPAFETHLRQYEDNGVFSYQDLSAMRQRFDRIKALPPQQQTVAMRQMLRSLSGEKPELVAVGAGGLVIDTLTGELKGVGSTPVTPSRSMSRVDLQLAAAAGDPTAQAVLENELKIQNDANEADRDFRRQMFLANNESRAATVDLRNQLTQATIDAKTREAQEEAALAETNKRAAQSKAQATIDIINKLVDFNKDDGTISQLNKGAAGLFGARLPFMRYIPGSTSDAAAYIDQLRSNRIVDLIEEMKHQSQTGATGFGQLNLGELRILEQASTVLNSSLITDATALNELRNIYRIAIKHAGNDPGGLR